jgi:hypothetical protein
MLPREDRRGRLRAISSLSMALNQSLTAEGAEVLKRPEGNQVPNRKTKPLSRGFGVIYKIRSTVELANRDTKRFYSQKPPVS